MTLTSAFSNAASGLAATAKAVQVASTNIANALTEGYGPRQIDLAGADIGGGVRVAGIRREIDTALLRLSRDANGNQSHSSTRATAWRGVEEAFGLPGAGLAALVDRLDQALITASARPDLATRLDTAVDAARDLALALNRAEAAIQSSRAESDAAIRRDVEALRDGLSRVDTLNDRIVTLKAAGQSTLSLEDERGSVVHSLSAIVPLQDIPRGDGRIMLFTMSGQMLLDLEPVAIGFDATPAITAADTLATGLGSLTINGQVIRTDERGTIAGGRLSANFTWRDQDAITAQSHLDALAHDLINRFAAVDASLPPGAAGLFTDAGAPAAAVPDPGLAGRLALNGSLDGASWRLRDGLGAMVPGATGDPSRINALSDALSAPTLLVGGTSMGGFARHLADSVASVSTQRQRAEDSETTAKQRQATITDQILSNGVDTDAEMQRLLIIEQSYAANARVIETADAMLRRLLEI